MKRFILLLSSGFIIQCLPAQTSQELFFTEDIERFWTAYNAIIQSADTAEQRMILESIYLDPASDGLKEFQAARNYTADTYLEAIRSYPEFWASIRSNTEEVHQQFPLISKALDKLEALYPFMKRYPIYFTIGAFRSNGTIGEDKVLIGCEMALGDRETVVDELPEHLQSYYTSYTPIEDLPYLCVHEFVHSQQQPIQHDLLRYCIYEGIAEYIADLACEQDPYLTSIAFHEKHFEKVRNRFQNEFLIPANTYLWLWSSNKIFGERDMGYAVGYEMAKGYYEQAINKQEAIRAMIELDLSDSTEIERYVNASGYFTRPLNELQTAFEASRPEVAHVLGITNGSTAVPSDTTLITVEFSEPLNGYHTGMDYGPLGEKVLPEFIGDRTWAEDGKTWSFTVVLEPNRHYQMLITSSFRKEDGTPLKPYLIDFQTGE